VRETLETPRRHLDLACSPASEAEEITLVLNGRLRSEAGVALADAGAMLTLDLPTAEELTETMDGCAVFPVE
jgi:hypothetical protein